MMHKAFMNFGKTRTKSTKRRYCENYTKLSKRENCEAYTIFLNRSICKYIRRYGCRLPSCLFCIRRLTAHNRLISCHFAPCLLYTECIHQFHCPIFDSQLMRVSCFATTFWLLNFMQWVIACMSPKLGGICLIKWVSPLLQGVLISTPSLYCFNFVRNLSGYHCFNDALIQ